MANISFIVTNSGTITAVANGKSYTIPRDHTNYNGIKDAVTTDNAAALERLANVAKTVVDFTAPVGDVEVRDGQVFWKGEVLHNVVTDKIFMLIREGYPVDPMVKFTENLLKNPSRRAVQELYKFLEHKGLPLTADGCFLGYKRVRDDFTDNHTGKHVNKIGTVLEMPRNTVDDEWRVACSSGFHVGSIEYVRNFHTGTGHVMIVKVNPADVVSVPEGEVTKLRTCKYEVVGEYDRDLAEALPETLFSATGEKVEPPAPVDADIPTGTPVDEDEDYDDEDEYDDEEDEDDEEEDESDEDAIERLTALAIQKGVDPVKLAFRLDVGRADLPTGFGVKDVVTRTVQSGDHYPEDVEDAIME